MVYIMHTCQGRWKQLKSGPVPNMEAVQREN